MSTTHFNRHEIFTATEMKLVSQTIELVMFSEVKDSLELKFTLENMLYGLYDGYLYSDILIIAMEFSQEIYENVLELYKFIDNKLEELEMQS
jgi:hypothetical protein